MHSCLKQVAVIAGVLVIGRAHSALAAEAAIDPALAAWYFAEARELCRRDGGQLWGHSLSGAILLVDPASREVVASDGDREGQLRKSGEVYFGKLPAQVMVGNMAIEWAGVK
jgi:hypothetical protein